jgi:hypothetical protein
MKVVDRTLIVNRHDFDHIMGYSDNKVPSEAFKEGLKVELEMHGIEPTGFDELKLELD